MSERRRYYEITTGSDFLYFRGDPIISYSDIALFDEVDVNALKKAAELTIGRFPFFRVRKALSPEKDRIVFEENDLPFPVEDRKTFRSMDEPESNGYPVSVCCHGKHILVSAFHGITDGLGLKRFAETLIYAYFEALLGRSFDCPGILNPHDEPRESEFLDPYECCREPEQVFRIKKKTGFMFGEDMCGKTAADTRLYVFSASEEQLVRVSKKEEGTVSGLLALSIARAIDSLIPQDSLPVVISCPMSVRDMLGCGETLRNCTKSIQYDYSPKVKQFPVDKQLSCLKGQMMLQSSEEYQLPRIMKSRQEYEQMLRLPGVEEKMRFFEEGALKSTPIVSYLGSVDMGELNAYIDTLDFFGRVSGTAGIQCAAFCFKGKCRVCTSYNLTDDEYIKAFVRQLGCVHIDCSEIEQADYSDPTNRKHLDRSLKRERDYRVNENGCSVSVKRFSLTDKEPCCVVLACHGFAGHKESSAIKKFADRLLDRRENAVVFAFDLPGHGDVDKADFSLENCDRYFSAMLAAIGRACPGVPVYFYGTSLGGYLGLKYCADHGRVFEKMSLRCPAVNIDRILKDKIFGEAERKELKETGKTRIGFDMLVTIDSRLLGEIESAGIEYRDFKAPADSILIIQGTADEIVDHDTVKRFAERNGIRFEDSAGADHRFLDDALMYSAIDRTIEYFGL